MIQLRPSEQFTIVRQLDDPFDTTTYYVRAVVRNLSDDSVLETINLTDNGSQRFSKAWSVVSDNTGDGRWISITTTVYTNSGYTTKSESYREQAETYLVQERFNPFKHRNLLGGGADVDYKRIRKIFEEELKKLNIEQFTKEMFQEIISPLVRRVSTISQEIKDASEATQSVAQEVKSIDFVAKMGEFKKELGDLVMQIKVPEPKEADLAPIAQRVDEIMGSLREEIGRVEKAHDTIIDLEKIGGSMSAIADMSTTLEQQLRDFIYAWSASRGKEEAKQKSFRELAGTIY